MSDDTIIVEVSKDSEGSHWDFLIFGEDQDTMGSPPTLMVPPGTSPLITLNIVGLGEQNAVCVFAAEPVSFVDENQNSVPPPSWFQQAQLVDDFNFVFMDDNTSNQQAGTFRFKIKAIFNDDPIESPDPTIINVGTDGATVFHFPKRFRRSFEPTTPDAVSAPA